MGLGARALLIRSFHPVIIALGNGGRAKWTRGTPRPEPTFNIHRRADDLSTADYLSSLIYASIGALKTSFIAHTYDRLELEGVGVESHKRSYLLHKKCTLDICGLSIIFAIPILSFTYEYQICHVLSF